MPDIRFHGQPFDDTQTAGAFIRGALASADTNRISVAVAWARFGGLIRLAPELRELRSRGGTARLIVGIDEGVATRPGLALALALFDHVAVVHDAGRRTFHPKLYMTEGPSRAQILVGSSNLTAAGLYFNFEASLEAEFDLPADEGHPAIQAVRAYLGALETDDACRTITVETLDDLVNDPRYRIAQTERRSTSPPPDPAIDANEVDDDAPQHADEGFGKSSGAVTFPPPLTAADRELLRELEGPVTEEVPAPGAAEPSAVAPSPPVSAPLVTAASWSKTMSPTDAQHPPQADSNPTGNLRLSQAGNAIDHRTWFRHEMFGECDWVSGTDSRGNVLETATVPMGVSIDGSDLGVVDMRVDHAPHREAGQNNVPTVLHWGSTLLPILRASERTDSVVTIARNEAGAYSLTIG